MRSMKTMCAAAMLIVCGSFARAQSPAPLSLDAMQFMQGKWVGEGTNETGGQGSGYFTFESDLQGKAWLRRNHSEYPGTNGRPAAVHDDLMIVYADAGTVRAFYTDTESHTIPYRVAFSEDKKTVTFVSDPLAAQPRYRLTYLRLDPTHMTVALEMATPDHPGEFKKVVEGRVRKTAP